ncbi:hypothetical protein SAMN05660199_04055 [Klenkia soli]|uniref:Uncharacterized protein n=1 Tax=Klenkia soli TaxID=1052260 RepID=A0A1H0T736_9ACTN|nr:hypothetical protein [Klenkia soli]SDP49286.1 hypothetical protein SAMN05660199_04055 [Klenkia soli]
MAWFRRNEEPQPVPAVTGPDPEDTPAALDADIAGVVRLVNASAGDLPVASVVAARRITDLLSEVVRTSDVRPLDIYAAISVRATATDYLPTTVRSFVALDPDLVDVPATSGTTPVQSLAAQLEALEGAAEQVLAAAQRQDVDALMTQGSFLRTKFSGSDLDL